MKLTNQFTAFVFAAAALALSNTASAQFSTPMRDIDNAVKGAVGFRMTCNALGSPAFLYSCNTAYAIPAGYRLAVTQLTGSLLSLSANTPVLFEIVGSLAGQNTVVSQQFLPSLGYTVNTASLYVLSANTHFTLDSISAAGARVYCNNCTLGSGAGSIQVSGYLVKL